MPQPVVKYKKTHNLMIDSIVIPVKGVHGHVADSTARTENSGGQAVSQNSDVGALTALLARQMSTTESLQSWSLSKLEEISYDGCV